MSGNNFFPKLHNAMWPGLVGKGADSEPPIGLDTMLELTAAARVDGVGFDGVDLFLADPHTPIDASRDDVKRLADKVHAHGLAIGSVVAPVWPPVGGGSAMGSDDERKRFLTMVEKACRIGKQLRDIGIRPTGVVRIDSASQRQRLGRRSGGQSKEGRRHLQGRPAMWPRPSASVWRRRARSAGAACTAGNTWSQLLEMVGRPATLGFQADMAHTLLYTMGYNAPEHRILPDGYDWKDRSVLDQALKTITHALRPWTIDFHVAQNDATVKGSGSHDKTGRHCMAKDPNGKLDIAHDAGYWLRDDEGAVTRVCKHICWDGCMFPNSEMMKPQTWNDILAAMIKVRDAHGWAQ